MGKGDTEDAACTSNRMPCDAELICQRIVTYCIDTPPEEGPDLGEYDAAFLAQAQGGGAA